MTFELPDGPAEGDEAGFEGPCGSTSGRDRAAELYFIGRMQASVAQAQASSDALARLAYFELAGRYSVAALAAGLRPAGCRLSDRARSL